MSEWLKIGVIDPYNPEVHTDAARDIEPRLSMLSPHVAAQRRKVVGIIPHQGIDWIFVNVDQLPIETAPPGGRDLLIGERYEPHPRTYSYNNGVYMAADREGHFFISCIRKLNVRGNMVEADGAEPLTARGFRERSSGVPFPSSYGYAVMAALLNGVVAGLATDYPHPPGVDNIGNFRFYSTPEKEVIADDNPPAGSTLVKFPSSR